MLKFEVRPQASKVMSIGSPLLALAITVVIGTCLFMILGKDPLKGLYVFFIEPVKSMYALSELAMKATPLLLIALGLGVCFRSIVWNLGAGLYYMLVDKGQSPRTVKALTRRIALSVALIAFVILAIKFGWIKPHGIGA